MSNKKLRGSELPSTRERKRASEIGHSCWTNLFLIESKQRERKTRKGPSWCKEHWREIAFYLAASFGTSFFFNENLLKQVTWWVAIRINLSLIICAQHDDLKHDSMCHLLAWRWKSFFDVRSPSASVSASRREKNLIAIFINCETSRRTFLLEHLDLSLGISISLPRNWCFRLVSHIFIVLCDTN